jgi:hypothetical protein
MIHARYVVMASLIGALLCPPSASAANWCWDEAARSQNVSPDLLRAIAAQESSCAVNVRHRRNANGSIDYGPLGINSSWLNDARFKRLNVGTDHLQDACASTYIAAWVLAACYQQFGVTWQAVGCYNAKSYSKQIKYANDIYLRLQRYYQTGKGIC